MVSKKILPVDFLRIISLLNGKYELKIIGFFLSKKIFNIKLIHL